MEKIKNRNLPYAEFVWKANNLKDVKAQLEEGFGNRDKFVVNKTIELSDNEFNSLCRNMVPDRDYIIENKEIMFYENEYNCILVYCKSKDFVFLIESEGFGCPRYIAIIDKSEAKQWIQ